jgi:hypothetical protein
LLADETIKAALSEVRLQVTLSEGLAIGRETLIHLLITVADYSIQTA